MKFLTPSIFAFLLILTVSFQSTEALAKIVYMPPDSTPFKSRVGEGKVNLGLVRGADEFEILYETFRLEDLSALPLPKNSKTTFFFSYLRTSEATYSSDILRPHYYALFTEASEIDEIVHQLAHEKNLGKIDGFRIFEWTPAGPLQKLRYGMGEFADKLIKAAFWWVPHGGC